MKKLNLYQIQMYNINQRIIHELTHLDSRLVLFSIVSQTRNIADISSMTKIPLSTAYQKLKNLEELSLIHVEKSVLGEGHKMKYYKNRIKGIEISISKQESKIILIKN